MPKVELHVHPEGTIRPETILVLMRNHSLNLGFDSLERIRERYAFTDFTHFIDTYTMVTACLKRAEVFHLAIMEYGRDLVAQHVIYAEIHFNPEPHWGKRGIDVHALLEQMNAARFELRGAHGLELRWIADGVRDADSGPASVDRTVDWMVELGHESGIVALGLGGNEHNSAVDAFASAFRRAKDAGFHVVAHAGEVLGPDAVREAVDILGAERIGHGVGSAHDPRLLEMLANRHIRLELCPTSNLRTGVIRSIEDFPYPAFRDAGVAISINSDDPPMFNTTLTHEYALIARTFALDRAGMIALVKGSIDQSFAGGAAKSRMHSQLDRFACEKAAARDSAGQRVDE